MDTHRLERTFPAPPEQVWELWTTPDGIARWWAPNGYAVDVQTLELRPGGTLVYTMTAATEATISFMREMGMSISTTSRKTFTEVDAPRRLAYASVVDFVPGIEPYEFLTTIDLEPADGGTHVVMTMDALHDEEWTQRLVAGRANELDNLAAVLR